MRCWAHGPQGQRCDQEVHEHAVDEVGPIHSFTVTWTEEECVDPAAVTAKVVGVTKTARPTPIIEVEDETFDTGRCFACQCPEDAHGASGCAEHGCSTYVP